MVNETLVKIKRTEMLQQIAQKLLKTNRGIRVICSADNEPQLNFGKLAREYAHALGINKSYNTKTPVQTAKSHPNPFIQVVAAAVPSEICKTKKPHRKVAQSSFEKMAVAYAKQMQTRMRHEDILHLAKASRAVVGDI